MERLLLDALRQGINEFDFWRMTPSEILRQMQANIDIKLEQKKEQAYFDYMQAQTIAHNIACSFNSSAQPLTIYDIYPNLFQQEIKQEEIDKRSAARFIQFVEAHNKKKGFTND